MLASSVFNNLSAAQIRKAADLKERIDTLADELVYLLSGTTSPVAEENDQRGRRMSAVGRAKIAAAARARWAKARSEKGSESSETEAAPRKRRVMSAAAKAKIAAAARA